MQKFFFCLSSVFVIVFLSGCINTTEVYTLNPDGSGKVVHEAIIQLDSPMFNNNVGPEIHLKEAVLSELNNAKGVEAWDNISYKYKDEKSIYFKGTAYFNYLSRLKFHNSGVRIPLYDSIIMSRDEKQFSIELKSSKPGIKRKDSLKMVPDTIRPMLTDAEIEEKLAKTRKEILEAKAMLTVLFADIKLDRTFYLPGTIAGSSNFEQNKDGSVRNSFEGSQLIELITARLDDEEWLRQQIINGKKINEDPLPAPHLLNSHLFGERALVKVVATTTDSPLFDYDAEIARAKVYYETFLNTLESLKAPPR